MLLCFSCYGQSNKSYNKRWDELNKGFRYEKSNRPAGPKKDYVDPRSLGEDNANNDVQSSAQPSEDNVIYSRDKRYKNGDNNGIKQNIKKGEEEKLNDLKKPNSRAPKVDYPDWNGPNWDVGDGSFFKLIFILIIIFLLAFLIYHFLFKNKIKSDKKIKIIDYSSGAEINPENIKKSRLVTDLEKAISEENFRLAVRIYYTLLLKALIEHDCIKWAKRKTNTHYLIEMMGHKQYDKFNRAVRIFEWSWYGKNKPSFEAYQRFSLFFDEFLNQLKDEK